MTKQFGNRIQDLRKERGLTVKELAQLAQVPSTLISGLQSGQRSVGENNALKIGGALGLTGDELSQFVYLALDEAKGKVLEENRGYPSQLLNLLAAQLRRAGIGADSISDFTIRGTEHQRDVTLHLQNGRQAHLSMRLVCA